MKLSVIQNTCHSSSWKHSKLALCPGTPRIFWALLRRGTKPSRRLFHKYSTTVLFTIIVPITATPCSATLQAPPRRSPRLSGPPMHFLPISKEGWGSSLGCCFVRWSLNCQSSSWRLGEYGFLGIVCLSHLLPYTRISASSSELFAPSPRAGFPPTFSPSLPIAPPASLPLLLNRPRLPNEVSSDAWPINKNWGGVDHTRSL